MAELAYATALGAVGETLGGSTPLSPIYPAARSGMGQPLEVRVLFRPLLNKNWVYDGRETRDDGRSKLFFTSFIRANPAKGGMSGRPSSIGKCSFDIKRGGNSVVECLLAKEDAMGSSPIRRSIMRPQLTELTSTGCAT